LIRPAQVKKITILLKWQGTVRSYRVYIIGIEHCNAFRPHLSHKFLAVFHKKITVYLEVFHICILISSNLGNCVTEDKFLPSISN